MVHKDLYDVFWTNGLQPELVYFFDGLNWLYVIMLTVILYGMKHTELLDWFTDLCSKVKINRKYSYWIASLITLIVFVIFRALEGNSVDASYVSGMLRSMFFTVIFESLFVDIPVLLIKGFGKFIDTKTDKKE